MMEPRIQLVQGDITKMTTDAIVNAANSSLFGGGGVDGAIHRAGGPAILEECRAIRNKQGGCPTGEAVITTGGKLPAKYVIHTVGPVWNEGKSREEELLASCYRNSLRIALENNIKTIAFPNISTGIYCFPKDKASLIAVNIVSKILTTEKNLEKIIFICFDAENHALYKALLSDPH